MNKVKQINLIYCQIDLIIYLIFGVNKHGKTLCKPQDTLSNLQKTAQQIRIKVEWISDKQNRMHHKKTQTRNANTR